VEYLARSYRLRKLQNFSLRRFLVVLGRDRTVADPIGAGMSVDRTNTIEWNGNELSGWIMINGAPTKVSADRDAIHTHARGFNDALTWEINRHRVEIFEMLVPFFQRIATTQAQ
jgi:hypothetical protein